MFTLDTSALIHLVRGSQTGQKIKDGLEAHSEEPTLFISIVTKAELLSFALQHNWGDKKTTLLNELFSETIIIPIKTDDILQRYAEVDSYSKGNLASRSLPVGQSAYNMGKNDLWIAATASITKSTLVTTDSDFDHLHQVYLDVLKFS